MSRADQPLTPVSPMVELQWAAFIFVLLIGGCAAGMWLKTRLKDHHRTQEALDSVRMIVGILVTFAALVLGLLVTSGKAEFDDHTDVYRRYGASLIQLDQRLQEYGAEAEPIRAKLRAYTASVIVDTWSNEPKPPGDYPRTFQLITPGSDESVEITALMSQIDSMIEALAPADPLHQRLASLLQDEVKAVETERWRLVEGTQSRLSPIFVTVLVFWLVIVFTVFGILTPFNILTVIIVGMTTLSVASSIYLILDLDTPFDGYITISSQPLRDALWHMDQTSLR